MAHHLHQPYQAQVIFTVVVNGSMTATELQVNYTVLHGQGLLFSRLQNLELHGKTSYVEDDIDKRLFSFFFFF